ncbi:nucleic acid-binding protein [Pluteus cervinus]|uniref:Nucleic acid-binding protein n=1 Tax=Pluteus cervinus TaxID=181527 RepID=A0ACD3BB61_9AGAR|nr:nucleic acid-binding protein [Pluteus cervinus]
MSLQAAISKLQSPVKELVLGVTQDGTKYGGETEQDSAEVVNWLEKTAGGEYAKEESFKSLNDLLVPRTYLVSDNLTAADIALYGSLHGTISKFQPPAYHALPALTRYFDHIQNTPPVRTAADKLSPGFGVVPFALDEAPKLERKVEPPKKKEKKPQAAAAVEETTAAAPVEGKAQKGEKKEKKEKKGDGAEEGGKKKAAAKTPAPEDGEPVPSMIDLRVGRIIDIKKHPDADGLYVEQIDIGEETGPRTVVSGLVNYIPIEEMRDKYLIAVCNLKPASMRGVKSFAMVLCATSKEGKEGGIEIVQPPPGSKPGERVYFEGEAFENATPIPQLNPKKKIFETVQPGFITLETREAAWVNPTTKSVHRIRTKDGVCLAPTFIGASLS